jgi:hypothetical protein
MLILDNNNIDGQFCCAGLGIINHRLRLPRVRGCEGTVGHLMF